ncbi:MAG: hypothetical protein KAH86_00005 [Methanosarcinales archaeon]|nr:hypothetical protein [Methanosarcinales archaeon]
MGQKKEGQLEDVSLLKFALSSQLKELQENSDADVVLFAGSDGRIYASHIPDDSSDKIFELTNLISKNLLHISNQLEIGLRQSIIEYDLGSVIFSAVGRGTILITLFSEQRELAANLEKINITKNVLLHIFEQRPMTDVALSEYDESISNELRSLSKRVFDEMYTQSSEYKKNMEILSDIKGKITGVMGQGEVEHVLTYCFDVLASSPKWMTSEEWMMLVERAIEDQIRPLHGDYIAEMCRIEWIPEIEKKLEAFM